MPTNRNTARQRAIGAVAVIVAALAAACSDGSAPSPLSPLARPAMLSAKDTPFDLDGDGKLDDAEKAAKKAADEAEKAARRLSKEEFERLKAEWKAYKKGVQDGTVVAEALRCEPSMGKAVTKRIGPKGGRIDVGAHGIDIPAGALTSDVEITASEKGGPTIELEFEPHGLQFEKPVELSFDYKGCVVPADAALDVVYVGPGWRVLETMPSTDKRKDTKLEALTDHFSGYLVAWGRTR